MIDMTNAERLRDQAAPRRRCVTGWCVLAQERCSVRRPRTLRYCTLAQTGGKACARGEAVYAPCPGRGNRPWTAPRATVISAGAAVVPDNRDGAAIRARVVGRNRVVPACRARSANGASVRGPGQHPPLPWPPVHRLPQPRERMVLIILLPLDACMRHGSSGAWSGALVRRASRAWTVLRFRAMLGTPPGSWGGVDAHAC